MKPSYISIHDSIKHDIETGNLVVGQRLPSERALAEQFMVSRMTLRQALSLLVDEGILERRVGSGTYVARARVQEKMSGTTSFTQIIKNQGKTPSSRLLSYRRKLADKTEREQLQLDESESYVIQMERVRYADNVPLVYEVASIPEYLIKDFKRQDITKQLFQTMVKNGYSIGKSRQNIYARVASEKIASILDMPKGQAILALMQVTYLEDGTPFEYVHSQYVGNRFEFYFESQ